MLIHYICLMNHCRKLWVSERNFRFEMHVIPPFLKIKQKKQKNYEW